MRITVLGASRFAVATIRALIEDSHEVILIEEDRERIDELAESLDCGMIHGDGTLPSTLEEAYGDGADAFVALTNSDNVNILSAAVARSIGYPRVVTQLTRSELQPIIDQLGLGETITPHETVARSLVEALEQHDQVSTVGVLRNQLRLAVVTVPDSSEEQAFSQIDLPESARGIARIREGDETEISADDTVRPGDQLLLLVSDKDHDRLLKLFAPEAEA